mmetsp:Transcript_112582/g.223808  ORF Transcript_112582/g.223808 Transcript_112582/m.223808 type:complete len:206 (+) Transcript_112582:431-1048(+)
MGGLALADLMPGSKGGNTSNNHKCTTHRVHYMEPCNRPFLLLLLVLILKEAAGQSGKPKITCVVVVIIRLARLFFGLLCSIIFGHALLIVLGFIPIAHKPFLTAGILVEVAATALRILFVTRECQAGLRFRHLCAIPTFGAFLEALAITFLSCKACISRYLAAALDQAIFPRFRTPRALCEHVAFPVRVILRFTDVNALCAIPQA